MISKYFLSVFIVSFYPPNKVFHRAKYFNFVKSILLFFSLLWVIVVVSSVGTLCLALDIKYLSLCFFFFLKVSRLIFYIKFMIRFELTVEEGMRSR